MAETNDPDSFNVASTTKSLEGLISKAASRVPSSGKDAKILLEEMQRMEKPSMTWLAMIAGREAFESYNPTEEEITLIQTITRFYHELVPLMRTVLKAKMKGRPSVNVFVSYTGADRESYAVPLISHLRRNKVNGVFNYLDMPVGSYPKDEMSWAAVSCKYFWCVLTKKFVGDWYPMHELMVGYIRHIQEPSKDFSFIGDCLETEKNPPCTWMDQIFQIEALKLYNKDGTVHDFPANMQRHLPSEPWNMRYERIAALPMADGKSIYGLQERAVRPAVRNAVAGPEELSVDDSLNDDRAETAADTNGAAVVGTETSSSAAAMSVPRLHGDGENGDDLLNVGLVAKALADTIAFKDLTPPFVMAILGGWGAGKSYLFDLMLQQFMVIQERPQERPLTRETKQTYVGHIYIVKFSAWTYAKGDLWASLMHQIYTDLNGQLDIEAKLRSVKDGRLLEKSNPALQIYENLSKGKREFLVKNLNDEVILKAFTKTFTKTFTKRGNVSGALMRALNRSYERDKKELDELETKRNDEAIEPILKRMKAEGISRLFEIALDEYKKKREKRKKREELNKGAGPTSEESMREELWWITIQWYTFTGGFDRAIAEYKRKREAEPSMQSMVEELWWITKQWYSFFAGGWSLTSVVLCLATVATVVLPILFKDKTDPLFSSLGAVPGFLFSRLKVQDGCEKIKPFYEVIEKASQKVVAENDLETGRVTKALRELDNEIRSLKANIKLVEGESIDVLVRDRLKRGDYESDLGIVHRAQEDLKELSQALLAPEGKDKIFPRGTPRIVLFIDDLDRCPPNQVVEMLEAIQLLVKTELFVVVMAVDMRYMTLALEKKYDGILHPKRPPSGLDYLEKIIQLPFRVPPIDDELVMKKYLKTITDHLPNTDSDDDGVGGDNDGGDDDDGGDGVIAGPVPVGADGGVETDNVWSRFLTIFRPSLQPPAAPPPAAPPPAPGVHVQLDESANSVSPVNEGILASATAAVPKEVIEEVIIFSKRELKLLNQGCVAAKVSPRCVKRLVNVFKLLKLIWSRQDEKKKTEEKMLQYVQDEKKETEEKMLQPVQDEEKKTEEEKLRAVRDAGVLLLAMSASTSKPLRNLMREMFTWIEQNRTTRDVPPWSLYKQLDYLKSSLSGEDKTHFEKDIICTRCMEFVKDCLDLVKWQNTLEWTQVHTELHLIRCFSFVGESVESAIVDGNENKNTTPSDVSPEGILDDDEGKRSYDSFRGGALAE